VIEVPEGFWELESSQNPEPISPMAESFFLDALTAAARHLFAEAGILAEGAEWRAFGGWVYLRTVPFAGDEQAMGERIGRCIEALEGDLAGRYLARWHDEWRPWLHRRAGELAQVDRASLDDAALDDHLGDVVAFLFAATDVHLLLHGSNALMLGELAFACGELLGWTEAQVFDLVSGSSTACTEPARRLADLADLARDRPLLRGLLDDPASAPARLAEVDPEFAAAFEAFLQEFGGRAIRYEVIDPTFGERPDLVLGLVRDQLTAGYDPVAVAARVATRQAATRAGARAALAERHPTERARFERLLERAERFYPVREDNEVWTVNVPLGLARRALLEVGRRLVASGAIAGRDDVFLLRLEEARPALHKDCDLLDVVTARQAERSRAVADPGPTSHGTAPPEPDLGGLPPAARLVHEAVGWLIDRVLAPAAAARRQTGPVVDGIPASPGRYTGPARVVLREDELGRLRPGDVLICPVTSPAWSMVFATVGAVVTDTGGILSHPAIVAREFGIPAVVATGNATALFVDGQIVTVDGDLGRVEGER
jgi:phosphohistidine swiveling domain-containing protein